MDVRFGMSNLNCRMASRTFYDIGKSEAPGPQNYEMPSKVIL